MPHDPKHLQEVLQAAAPLDVPLSFRPMFGGIMGYADGLVFASLSDVGLALKMSGANYGALLALPGCKPLRYAPDDPPSKSYVVVPDTMLGQREVLSVWVAAAIAGAKPKPTRGRR